MNDEIKRIIIDQGHYTQDEYPYTIKPKFSTLGSIIEILPRGPIISFASDDSIRNLIGFYETLLYKGYNLSDDPADFLSFDNIFLERDITEGMIFRGERSGVIHNFTIDVDPRYKYIEKFLGGVQWYVMSTRNFFSSNNLK